MMKIRIFAILLILISTPAGAATLADEDFDDLSTAQDVYDGTGAWGATTSGYEWMSIESSGCKSGKCAKISWPTSTGNFQRLVIPVSTTSTVHIRFWFKYSGDTSRHPKYLKLHGRLSDENYANTTGTNGYSGWAMQGYVYGSGSGLTNDNTIIAAFYNDAPSDSNSGSVSTYTPSLSGTGGFVPTADTWHLYEVLATRNTDGNSDGELKVWIDESLIYHLENWRMRHDDNPDGWSQIDFGAYMGAVGSSVMETWFDEILVTDTDAYIGTGEGGNIKTHNSGAAALSFEEGAPALTVAD